MAEDLFETLGGQQVSGPIVSDPNSLNLDDYVGLTWQGKPIIGLTGVIAQIDSGQTERANAGQITYSFNDVGHLTGLYNNPTIGFTAGNGYSPFSAAQRDAARASIQLWDDLIAVKFVEKNGQGADIVFANSWDPAQAYAYYPGEKGYKFQSDVFIAGPEVNPTNNWLGFNGYGKTTLIHELGHAIGLSHPGDYNYDPNLPLSYANYAEYAQDSEQYSIMSYWGGDSTGAFVVDWSTFFFANSQTPMLHDILTIQAKYGADPNTRTGNTVYGFNSNAGNAVYDFNLNPFPYLSIYDAGGNDTIDLSGFNAGVFLDLHAGSFSSAAQAVPAAAAINANRDGLESIFGPLGDLSQAQVTSISNSYINYNAGRIGADTGVGGVAATASMNLSIAYGTTIENGIGGSQRDVIWGNEVDNLLKGLGGNDVINGFEGKDTMWGGTGNDVFQFSFIEKGDKIADFEAGDRIDLRPTGVDFTFIGGSAFSGAAGQLRFAGGELQGDVNGDGLADLAVTVVGGVVLASNLLIL
jgi:serralysin